MSVEAVIASIPSAVLNPLQLDDGQGLHASGEFYASLLPKKLNLCPCGRAPTRFLEHEGACLLKCACGIDQWGISHDDAVNRWNIRFPANQGKQSEQSNC